MYLWLCNHYPAGTGCDIPPWLSTLRSCAPTRSWLRVRRCKPVQTKRGIYLFGPIRQSDWIPVHSKADAGDYHTFRSEESDSDYDSDDEEQYARSYANYIEHGPGGETDSGSDDSVNYADICRNTDEDDLCDGYSDDSNSINSDDEGESRRRTDDYIASLRSIRGPPPQEDYSSVFQATA